MYGPAGSGKSTFARELTKNLECRIISLDDYRIQINNGVYPVGDKAHRSVNKIAIPLFKKELKEAQDRVLVVDNTHAKWDPDWGSVIDKAQEQNYFILTLPAPLGEFTFFECRSSHEVPLSIYWDMVSQWGGYRFSPFLYRLINPEQLARISPLRGDPPFRLKGQRPVFTTWKWGDGIIFRHTNYLGYIDRDMVRTVVSSGFLLQEHNREKYFMRKDGPPHITLYKPSQGTEYYDKLGEAAETLVQLFQQPPKTSYTGIKFLTDGHKTTSFICLESTSQQEWRNITTKVYDIFHSKDEETSLSLNMDGFHVTLGYEKGDIYNINKAIDPDFYFEMESKSLDISSYLPPFINPNNGNSKDEGELFAISNANLLSEYLQEKLGKGQLNIDQSLNKVICFLLENNNVKNNVKLSENGSLLLGFRVQAKNRSPDEVLYRRNPLLQTYVPRGLHYCFEKFGDTIQYIGCVYPTSKFFGDEDCKDDVQMATDEELKHASRLGTEFIVTEKANGEMFTFSVLSKESDNRYTIVTGGKNSKYIFKVAFGSNGTTLDSIILNIQWYIEHGPPEFSVEFHRDYENHQEWITSVVWIEMTISFFDMLLKNPKAVEFCELLLSRKLTACGEFESYLHPHIFPFPHGHQLVRFFAFTSCETDGQPKFMLVNEYLTLMEQVKSMGFSTINIYPACSNSLIDIRNNIRSRVDIEGVVLLVVQENKIIKLIKLKTVYYIIHRGIRESLRSLVMKYSHDNDHPKAIEAIVLKKILQKIEQLKNTTNEDVLSSEYWQSYAMALGETISDILRTDGSEKLRSIYKFNYPSLIERANKLRESHII